MGRTGKARFFKAAKRLERLVGNRDEIPAEEQGRVLSAV